MEKDELQSDSQQSGENRPQIVVKFSGVENTPEKWRLTRRYIATTYGIDEDGVIPEG